MRTVDRTDDRSMVHTIQRIGRTQELTPEGFLLCRDVRIARTGEMLYGPGEIAEEIRDADGVITEIRGIEPGRDGIVRAVRGPEDLFAPAAMASYVGKAVTIDHPDTDVGPDNWASLAHGMVLSTRQGDAPFEDDCLLADLLLTSADAIDMAKVEPGAPKTLPEVSCGYDAAYTQLEPGRARQFNLFGNHVALVKNGRCGPRCAIGDSAMTKPSLVDRIRAAFTAKDETALAAALGEVEAGNAAAPGATVHVHVGTRDEASAGKTEDGKEGEKAELTKDEAPAWFTAYTKTNDARMDALEAKFGTKDAAAEVEEEKDGEKGEGSGKTRDAATVDSADLTTDFTDMLARGEILAPGIKLPTFDGTVARKLTVDRMCAFKRRALVAAQTGDNAEAIDALIGAEADVATLTCDAVGTVFTAASELVKRSNDSASIGFVHAEIRTQAPSVASISEINARNAAYWASKQ